MQSIKYTMLGTGIAKLSITNVAHPEHRRKMLPCKALDVACSIAVTVLCLLRIPLILVIDTLAAAPSASYHWLLTEEISLHNFTFSSECGYHYPCHTSLWQCRRPPTLSLGTLSMSVSSTLLGSPGSSGSNF